MVLDTLTGTDNGKTATRPTTRAAAPQEVAVLEIDIRRIIIPIHGTSPLIMHQWSAKAKAEMLSKQMKEASRGKEPKDPQRDYEESIYYVLDADGQPALDEQGNRIYGFPAVAFKSAAVAAGRYCDMKMTYLRGAFHVEGERVRIEGTPHMREDMVRVGMGTADIRFRAEFTDWSAAIPVRYNARTITVEQIVNLFKLAGFSVGIGEWRPEKDGPYGLFDVGSPA